MLCLNLINQLHLSLNNLLMVNKIFPHKMLTVTNLTNISHLLEIGSLRIRWLCFITLFIFKRFMIIWLKLFSFMHANLASSMTTKIAKHILFLFLNTRLLTTNANLIAVILLHWSLYLKHLTVHIELILLVSNYQLVCW